METMKPKTNAQKVRQKPEYRSTNGRYEELPHCYVCNKCVGEAYWSHPDTDRTISDRLLCLCKKCYDKCKDMPGTEAVKMFFGDKNGSK